MHWDWKWHPTDFDLNTIWAAGEAESESDDSNDIQHRLNSLLPRFWVVTSRDIFFWDRTWL